MNDFSVSMALVDYIPVIFFAIAAVILQRDLYNKMSKGAFALFAAGTINVTCAGALKATWKLLYALGVCNFEALNAMFFPVQSIGFLLAGIGILAMLTHKQTKSAALCSRSSRIQRNVRLRRTYGCGTRHYGRRPLHPRRQDEETGTHCDLCAFICLLALHGISLVAGFRRGFDELDRRGR